MMEVLLTGILFMCLSVAIGAEENATAVCTLEKASGDQPGVKPVLDKYQTALVLLLGFGGFSVLLAFLYMTLRRRIFHDADNMDTSFDAGGRVSLSLTAVTAASQFTWPGDLLNTATVTIQSGVAGPYFFAAGIVFSMLLFPMLSVTFKIRCPGAKTYLQMFHARFGTLAHIHYTILALLVNVMVMSCLVVSAKATIQALTKDASDEFVVFIIAALFGSYSFIGGLGSTFYVSYFNGVLLTVSISILVGKVFFSASTEHLGLGDLRIMYNTLECLEGPPQNFASSFLTFRSKNSVLWGIVALFAASAITFGDQAVWQSRIAAKPNDGVWGFILATAIYLSIPSVIGTTAGLAYLAMSSQTGTNLLTGNEILTGLTTPFVALQVFGVGGAYLILTMTTMALMATGSGEVMGISSIIVYDIYSIHINPFRKGLQNGMCILCGRRSRYLTEPMNDNTHEPISVVNGIDHGPSTEFCDCPSIHDCPTCSRTPDPGSATDADTIHASLRDCPTHGALRKYQDRLLSYKSWCILWVSIAIVPFGLLVLTSGITLTWTLLYGCAHVVSGLPGVLLTILWSKTTKEGVIFGGLLALAGSFAANLGVASTFEGGLYGVDNFFKNTVQLESAVAGAGVSILVGFISIIAISLYTTKVRSYEDEELEWEKTRNIDNLLHPWSDRLQEDFPDLRPGQRPTNAQMIYNCRHATLSAYIGAGICMSIFIIIIPGVMAIFPVLTFAQFKGWVYSVIAWSFVMILMVIVIAPVQESVQILRRHRRNKQAKHAAASGASAMQTFKAINT